MKPVSADCTLRIEKTAFGGDGIAFHEGKVIFVEGALPGEQIRARFTEDKKNFGRAQILEILEKSPHRQDPPCVYVKHCGGCQYQHVDYEEELHLKQSQILDIFSSVPGVDISHILPITPSDKPYAYRNGLTLHTIPIKPKGSKILGFIGKDNLSRIPVEKCLLADDRLNAIFKQKYTFKDKAEKIAFKLSESGEIISDLDERYFRVRVGDAGLLTSSRGFFQNNLYMAGKLTEKVSQWMEGRTVDQFYDLYAGSGMFAFICGKNVPKIYCIEEEGASIQALKMNASESGFGTRLEIVEGRVEHNFRKLWERTSSQGSMLLLDPPRQGLSQEMAQYLAEQKHGNPLICYVSCDPTTMARDLKTLLLGGAYKVAELAPFDMFPRTAHIEVVALLVPNSP